MDAALFHPKVVHVPLALSVLMPLITGVVLVSWWRNWLPARTWWLVILLQAILVVSGVVALRTGETEEHRVEEIVGHDAIEVHEEAAEKLVWIAGAILALMIVAQLTSRGRLGQLLALGSSLGTVVVLFLGIQTGQAGGELVYVHGAADAYTQPTDSDDEDDEKSRGRGGDH